MLIGYARISTSDDRQSLDLQIDALAQASVDPDNIYSDRISGKKDTRPGLDACLKALRRGDTLIVWKLDRLGRSLRHLIQTVETLTERKIGLKVLTGQGASIDTTTPEGRLVFSIFAALAEFERDLIIERTRAGLASARARGRVGGRKPVMTRAMIRRAEAAMKDRQTIATELAEELGISVPTLYRYIGPDGALRPPARKILGKKRTS